MEEMYDVLTKCQIKLECCKPDEVDEWQIEVYIFRLKTRLLYCAHVRTDGCIETLKTLILKFYGEVCDLYNMKSNYDGVVEYESRIKKLTMVLKNIDLLLKQSVC